MQQVSSVSQPTEQQQPNSMQNIIIYNKVLQQVAPYVLFSGKIPDDLGFPGQCVSFPSNLYFTAEMTVEYENSTYTMYYGLCFDDQCTVDDLNQNGVFLINAFMGEQIIDPQDVTFYQPNLNTQMNIGAIVMQCYFSLLIIIFMVWSFIRWGKQCLSQPLYVQEEMQMVQTGQEMLEQQAPRFDPQPEQFLEKISLEVRFKRFLKKQQSLKIMQFSIFKIVALPLIIYGQLFYMTNFGAYNYYAFNRQLYDTFFAKVGTFAYYLPDIFFFISGFLFSRKMFTMDQYKDQKFRFLGIALFKKLVRLYPLYITCTLIYWFITPTLHAGPVWFVYQRQAEVCNYAWWRSLILIDNWWGNGCYSPAWFIQVQFQLLLITSIFFVIYFFRRIIAVVLISLLTLATWVLMYIFTAELPVDIDITLNPFSQLYYRSLYSHAPFYLFGLIVALISQKQSVRSVVKQYFVEKLAFLSVSNILAAALVIVILLRPSVWHDVLGLQLALCRTGIFFSFLILFIPGIFSNELNKTRVHKFAYYTYPIILVFGFITMSSFWCYETFPYVSGMNILNSMVPSLLISIAVGVFLGLLFDFRTFRIK